MTERVRITRIKAGKTQSGKDIVEMYSHDTRLQYPVLRLFDLSALLEVGLDPADLTDDETHCNFWAHYELSDKTSSRGHPYKDVVALEAIDKPATTTSVDNSAIVAELRAIKALLLQMVTDAPPALATPDTMFAAAADEDQGRAARLAALTRVPTHGVINGPLDPQATDPTHVLEHLKPPKTEDPPLSEGEARTEFYTLAGPAIAEGRIDAAAVNDLVRDANGGGWPAALQALKEKLS